MVIYYTFGGYVMLYLRELTDEDISTVKNWIMQDYISQWFGDVSDWEKELKGRNDEYNFIKHFILERDGEPIGFCQYYNWNSIVENEEEYEPVGTYGIDYLIGSKELLGKGIGKEIVKLICDKVIESEENVTQIVADPTIEVKRKNVASIKTLEANGFSFDERTELYRKRL